MLDPNFYEHIRALPSVYSPNAYREFIDAFGTHFVRRLQLGGAKHQTLLFEDDYELNERQLTSEISGGYSGQTGSSSMGLSFSSGVSSAKNSTKLNVSGGDPTAPTDGVWRDSLYRFEPHAFPASLASLAIFLPSPQREHFERTVKEVALAHHLQKSKAVASAGEKDGNQWLLGKVRV